MRSKAVVRRALVIVVLGAPQVTAAQEGVRLAALPTPGVEVHRLFQTRTRVAFQGRDPTTLAMTPPVFQEAAQLGGMRQVVVPGPRGQAVLHLAFDSLTSRTRDAGEAWRELAVGGLDTLWVQVDIDEQWRVGEARTAALNPGQGLLIELASGIPGLELPNRAVQRGWQWTQDIEMPVGAFAIRAPRGLDDNTVSTNMRFTVDSIVPRERDTLAYVAFSGDFRSKVQHLADGSVRRTSGATRGTFIWSTGWRTIVAETARMQLRVATHVDGQPDSRMRELGVIDTTVQTQVRPGP